MSASTLLHVDSDPLHTAWVRERVQGMPDFKYLGGVRTAGEAEVLCRSAAPDVLVTELSLPDREGLELAEEVRRAGRGPQVLVFTATAGEWTLYRLCRAPIAGIVWKTPEAAQEFDAALAGIRAGRPYFPRETQVAMAELRSRPDAFFKILSDREIELLPLFGRCLSDAEVGRAARLSQLTARYHRQSIMRKLGIHRRHELIGWCLAKGFARVLRPVPPCEIAFQAAPQSGLGSSN